MIDFRLLLSRIQAVYSLQEVASMLGCDRKRLHKVKAGIVPKWDYGLRIVMLHDQITGRDETGAVLGDMREKNSQALGNAVPRFLKAQRVTEERPRARGRFVRGMGDIPEEGDELDRLDMQDMPSIEVLQRSQTAPERLPGNRASDIPALPRWAVCGEGQERQSNPGMEGDFDRLIHELECGEGESR